MKLAALFVVIGYLGVHAAYCQKEVNPTNSFTITGEVKSPAVVHALDLKKWSIQNISDIVITNHLGEKKSEGKGLNK